MKIGILDYGMSNLGSVNSAFARLKAKSVTVKSATEILNCDGLVIPGVGAFSEAMKQLSRLQAEIAQFAASGRPILGICLGMQVLFEEGTENGISEGLGLLQGKVEKLSAPKLPHVGWNEVKQTGNAGLFRNITDNSCFYFVHSYACNPSRKKDIVATTVFENRFASAVERGNILGVQFHPEKSGKVGEALLKNFCEVVKCK